MKYKFENTVKTLQILMNYPWVIFHAHWIFYFSQGMNSYWYPWKYYENAMKMKPWNYHENV